MLRLANGNVIATSGLGSDGKPNQTIELNTNPDNAPWTKGRTSGCRSIPISSCSADRPILLLGWQDGHRRNPDPLLFDPLNPTNAIVINGLDDPGDCNES